MQIFYSALPAAVQAAFYARVRQVLSHGGQAIVIVPAQASFLTERGILDKLGLDGFLDLEVLSFEKLTERVAALSGGRAVQTLDASGFAMLAKLALAGCAGELCVLDSRDPSLHMRAAELIASLKSEGIAPEEIDRLADGAAGAGVLLPPKSWFSSGNVAVWLSISSSSELSLSSFWPNMLLISSLSISRSSSEMPICFTA